MLHTLITRLHGRALKATSSSCLVALLTRKRHFNDASLNLPLKLSLLLHHQQARSYSGGGDSSKISNSIQAMSKYCSATINKQFDLSLRPRLALKLHCDMSMYIITGFARNLESTTSISRTYRPKASQLTVLQNCCLVRDTKIGYHFYISVLFLLHNELLQYKYSSWFLLHGFTGLTRLYTLQCSILSNRDTAKLHTERKQIRSHMLLRTLISEVNQHRDGGRSPTWHCSNQAVTHRTQTSSSTCTG